MERLENINVERIKATAGSHQLTVESVFDELSIAKSTLELLYETNSGLTWSQLSKIAKHLNRGVLYFMEQGNANQLTHQSVQFRSLENQKPGLSRKLRIIIENIERHREIYLSLREYIDYEPLPFIPRQMPSNAEDAAEAARSWLNIERENSFSKTRLEIERAGALVVRSNGYHGAWKVPSEDDVLGFSLFYEVCPIIFVRKQDSDARQLFTLAHELGHLLLHKKHFIDGQQEFSSSNKQEVEANKFAGHFLLPTELLAEINDDHKPQSFSDYSRWLNEYTREWGVSIESILRRLLDEERLTLTEYNSYRTWHSKQTYVKTDGGSRKYRHREPRHLFGDGFVSAVIQSLRENRITLVQASQYLDNLKADDVKKLESYYAGN